MEELKLARVQVVAYLDDWLVWGESEEVCHSSTKIVIEIHTAKYKKEIIKTIWTV